MESASDTSAIAAPQNSIKIAVFGGGSFGTALAYTLSKNSHEIVILTRSPKVASGINEEHRNPSYLSDYVLPRNIRATTDPKEAITGASFILHAIPVQASPDYLKTVAQYIPPDLPIINSSKGLHTQSLEYMSQIIPKVLERDQPMIFFSGPSFAKELMQDSPTAVVVASADTELRERVQKLFASPCLRVYTTDDVVGVEVGGALKNVFAIGAGVVEGLGLGLNTLAALVTRGVAEMTKLAIRMGARPSTVSGLSGVGDLMLTCFGSLSRNRQVGKRLGQGETIQQILESMNEVAEGVATSGAAVKLAEQYSLDLPIVRTVNDIIDGRMRPKDAVVYLMTLPVRPEDDY